jgi:uncharacterized protein RhaS with RHS repeats
MYLSQDPIGLAGTLHLYGYVNDVNAWIDILGLSRRGSPSTRTHMDTVRDRIIQDNPGILHTGGGRSQTSGTELPETYLKPLYPTPASTKGGSYVDMTFEISGQKIYIQTVDKGSVSGMSQREWTNANRILQQDPNAIVVTVVKGKALKPGDLAISKFQKGQVNCA